MLLTKYTLQCKFLYRKYQLYIRRLLDKIALSLFNINSAIEPIDNEYSRSNIIVYRKQTLYQNFWGTL